MKFLILLLSFLTVAFQISAQRNCGSFEYARSTGNTYNQTTVDHSIVSRDTVANEIITIPVVIHVIYHNTAQNITDAQVLSQLKALNEDFRRMNADAVNTPDAFKPFAADSRIMFCLAQVNPIGRAQRGIIRKFTNKESFNVDDAMKFSAAGGDDAWDTKKYMNIWVCNMQNNLLGYATQPGGQADKDGIVIQYDAFGTVGSLRANFNKGRTATHEIGHWMGLRHVWGDNSCGDDGIGDTPQQSGYNNNCPSFPHLSSCSPDANGDMFMNFMDYTNDGCMNMFTEGQKIKMRSLFSAHGLRNSFLLSFACDSSFSTAAPLPVVDSTPIAKAAPTVQIYPNPVQHDLNLMALNGYDLTGKSIAVMSATGQVKFKKTISKESDKLDCSSLQSGVYIIIIGQGADKVVLKLIKV